MLEIFETNPQIDILDSEFNRLLGYPPGHKIDGPALELKQNTAAWYKINGRPWLYARRIDNITLLKESFTINGVEFNSKRVRNSFEKAATDKVFVVAASAGRECENKARQLWLEGKPDEYFFMEMYGSAVVENLITGVGAHFCAWAEKQKLTILPHYSPGYQGWDISDQNPLMDIIKQSTQNKWLGNIDVMHSGMLNPKKSLLAVFGISAKTDYLQSLSGMVPCENCSLPNCTYRRKPYKRAMGRIEDIHKMNARFKNKQLFKATALDKDALYSVSAKALKKWTQNRLKLQKNADGTFTALFRYDGSTCSNLGRPLAYEYRLKLGPAAEGYPIIAAQCQAADGENGYTSMCEYRRNPALLTEIIEQEKPLLGKSINAVLTWEHTTKHCGCYCDQPSRNHKWRIVYEVIHYALVQRTIGEQL